jgi:ribonuclease-3
LRAPADRLAQALGHRFSHAEVLEQALTHRSAGVPHNERLEFLGDALLDFLVADALYRRFGQADEGRLSRLRAGLVRKESLAGLARTLDLGAYLNLGAGELRTGGHARDSILADALEAVLAAIYLDGGMGAAQRVVSAVFGPQLDAIDPDEPLKDPKTRLQELLQGRRHALPDYEVVAVDGSQHAQQFQVRCRLPELGAETRGHGSSRRRAEQQAARRMLERLLGED